ncbi:histidine kinase dimerization/phosphoacceptor domain -containing protein [Roseivirga echinicomitans]
MPASFYNLSFTLVIVLWAQLMFGFEHVASAQETIEINTAKFEIPLRLGKSVYVFEDTTQSLTINDILWSRSFGEALNGPNELRGVYWLKLTLKNNTAYDREVVVTGFQSIDSRLYLPLPSGEIFTAAYGSFIKRRELNLGDGRTHVSFNLKAGVLQDIYFRVHGRGFKGELTDASTFRQAQDKQQIQDFLFFGACLIFVIYSLVQFTVYRFWPYLWLAVFAMGMGMYAVAVQGYFVNWFLPNSPEVGTNFTMVWSQVGQMGMLFLAISFLRLKSRFPLWYKVFVGLVWLTVVRVIVGVCITWFYQDYGLMTNLTLKLLMIDIAFFHLLLFSIWKQVNQSGRIFLIGLVLFGFALIIGSFTWMYIFNSKSLVLMYITTLSSLLQVLIFSIALGVQMRQHERDKNTALNKINIILKEQNIKIESEVIDRTKVISEQKVILEQRNERIETLFKEIHHRVKNNLQLISSLLNMQQEWSGSKGSAEAIEESRSRVVAMSMIHQFLYRTDDIATIDFRDYVIELVKKIDSIQTKKIKYKLVVNFEEHTNFDLDTSIPLGLIINELLTNSYKHTVVEKNDLQITLDLHSNTDGMLSLVYRDNGAPLPDSLEVMTKKGFGLRLASRLAAQLYGSLVYDFDQGNKFTVQFANEALRLTLVD